MEDKEKEKRDLAKAATASGAGLVAVGGGTYLTGKAIEKAVKADKDGRVLRAALKTSAKFGVTPETLAKATKKGGKITAAVGAPILAVGAYKHYKYKKKDKDANSEK